MLFIGKDYEAFATLDNSKGLQVEKKNIGL